MKLTDDETAKPWMDRWESDLRRAMETGLPTGLAALTMIKTGVKILQEKGAPGCEIVCLVELAAQLDRAAKGEAPSPLNTRAQMN